VKICGVTNPADARLVEEVGADFIGALVDVPDSPRNLTLERAMSVFAAVKIRAVLLTIHPHQSRLVELVGALRPFAVQLLGEESPSEVTRLLEVGAHIWKSIHMPPRGQPGADAQRLLHEMRQYADAGVSAFVLDTKATIRNVVRHGGTGMVHDWEVAAEVVAASPLPVFLAGGIDPNNVAEAIERVRPQGLDLSSGVEAEVGRKDAEKMRRLMAAIRQTEARLGGPPAREGKQP